MLFPNNSNALSIKGVPVDDTAKADGKALEYNASEGKIVYATVGGGSTPTLDQVLTAGSNSTHALSTGNLTVNGTGGLTINGYGGITSEEYNFSTGAQFLDDNAHGIQVSDGDGNIVLGIQDGGGLYTFAGNTLDDGGGNMSVNGNLYVNSNFQLSGSISTDDGQISSDGGGNFNINGSFGVVGGTTSLDSGGLTTDGEGGITCTYVRTNSGFYGVVIPNFTTVTTSQNVAVGTSIYLVNAATTLTLTLPNATSHTGQSWTIKSIQSAVTVATTSSQTIDGSTTYSLSGNHKYVTVFSDGTHWQIIGNN